MSAVVFHFGIYKQNQQTKTKHVPTATARNGKALFRTREKRPNSCRSQMEAHYEIESGMQVWPRFPPPLFCKPESLHIHYTSSFRAVPSCGMELNWTTRLECLLHFSDLNDRTILLEVKEEQEEIPGLSLGQKRGVTFKKVTSI